MDIRLDDLAGPEIRSLLEEHLTEMAALSPRESVHALDVDALRGPDITLWTLWSNGMLLGCGALKTLDATHAEIKSMRTASAHRRQGVASTLLAHIVEQAKQRGFARLSLETGSSPAFDAAHTLYTRFSFVPCAPFAQYVEDPHSLFMTRLLRVTE